jgi:hypothetical protein
MHTSHTLQSMQTPRKRKPSTDQRLEMVGLRIEIWLKHALEELARKEERTLTQVCRHAMKEYVERRKAEAAA